jgi:hypothetical protein
MEFITNSCSHLGQPQLLRRIFLKRVRKEEELIVREMILQE